MKEVRMWLTVPKLQRGLHSSIFEAAKSRFCVFLCPEATARFTADSKAGHLRKESQLCHTLVVRFLPGGISFCLRAGLVVVIRASRLWHADGFVAGIRALQSRVMLRLGFVRRRVEVLDSGVEVTGGGGRDHALDLRNAAVVVLLVFLTNSTVTVRFVDRREQSWLQGAENTQQNYENNNKNHQILKYRCFHCCTTHCNCFFQFSLFKVCRQKQCCCLMTGNRGGGNRRVKHTITSLSDRMWLLQPGDRGECNCGEITKRFKSKKCLQLKKTKTEMF